MTSNANPKLNERLAALVREDEARREGRRQELGDEMSKLDEFQARFQSFLGKVRAGVLEPRIDSLFSVLCCGTIKEDLYGYTITIRPDGTRYTVSATLSIQIRPNPYQATANVSFEVLVLPILSDYERNANLELPLTDEGVAKLEKFVDDRMEKFLSDYLAMHAPDSPYQRNSMVADPVCGMVFPRSDATAKTEFGGRTFYFCNAACCERFKQEPHRYDPHA